MKPEGFAPALPEKSRRRAPHTPTATVEPKSYVTEEISRQAWFVGEMGRVRVHQPSETIVTHAHQSSCIPPTLSPVPVHSREPQYSFGIRLQTRLTFLVAVQEATEMMIQLGGRAGNFLVRQKDGRTFVHSYHSHKKNAYAHNLIVFAENGTLCCAVRGPPHPKVKQFLEVTCYRAVRKRCRH